MGRSLPLLITLWLALGLTGCLPKIAPVALQVAEPVLLAHVHDQEDVAAVRSLPAELLAEVEGRLERRNLEPRSVNHEQSSAAFERRRATGQRLDWLRSQAAAGELVVLIETRASPGSQMAGRWRWTVSARLSVFRSGKSELLDAQLEVPVFLQFGHEDESDALLEAQATLLRRLERLVDTALSAPAGAESLGQPGGVEEGAASPGLIYFVMVDRFANGETSNDGTIDRSDPSAFHGGDLRGLIDRLDHLEDLGVGTVWLSPVFAMRTEPLGGHGAFHGYWLEDPFLVEPRFGTEEDLRELAAALEARGMGLYLDMVTNHVAYDSARVTSSPDWFHGLGDVVDWSDPEQALDHDVHGLPDLDQAHPEVREWLFDAGRHWVGELPVTGFRLDAVRHVPLGFWADYNREMRAVGGEDFELLGEMFDGDPAVIESTWRAGAFSSMFDFPLHYALVDVFCKGAPAGRLASVLWADRLYQDPGRLVTFVDNHDLPRAMSACGEDAERVAGMLRFLFAVRGTPAITWGTEAGLRGEGEPENRADMAWEGDFPLADVLRGAPSLRPETAGGRVVALDDEGFHYLRADGDLVVVRDGRTELQSGAGQPLELAEGVVRVAASGSPAGAGDRLVLVGAGPELGSWSPERGIELPIEGMSFPAGAVLDFKLVVLRGDGEVLWEPRTNRYALIEAGMSLELELTWSS